MEEGLLEKPMSWVDKPKLSFSWAFLLASGDALTFSTLAHSLLFPHTIPPTLHHVIPPSRYPLSACLFPPSPRNQAPVHLHNNTGSALSTLFVTRRFLSQSGADFMKENFNCPK